MAQHARLKIDAGVQVYFCDPQSPWQRGTNENTNGLLRQYFPKGTDLSVHSAEEIAAVRPPSTPGHERRSTGKRPQRRLTNGCGRSTRSVLRRPIKSAQYACGDYRKLLKANGITASMSRKGNCLDNAPMESFFGALKTELVHRTRFRTRREAKAVLFEYIEVFYNRQRRHSSVGYRTPAQARVDMTTANAA